MAAGATAAILVSTRRTCRQADPPVKQKLEHFNLLVDHLVIWVSCRQAVPLISRDVPEPRLLVCVQADIAKMGLSVPGSSLKFPVYSTKVQLAACYLARSTTCLSTSD